MTRTYYLIFVSSLFLILILKHSPVDAQDCKITVSVEGKKKNKKTLKEVKKAVCDSILDHLTFSLPDLKFPDSCNTAAKKAVILLRAEAIFEYPATALNLYLELRNLTDDSIIKQRSHTVNIPKGTKNLKDLIYIETTSAMKDLVPQGWKPHIVKAVTFKEKEEKIEEVIEPTEPSQPVAPPQPVEPVQPAQPPTPAPTVEPVESAAPPEPVESPAPTEPVEPPKIEEKETPKPPANVGLLLAISAKDASISIDGNYIGKSPFEVIQNVPPGKHQITAVKDGYKKYSGSFEIPAGEEEGIFRHDVFLESKKKKKKKSLHKKWWVWTVVGVIVAGGAAGATTAILLTKDKTNAVPFPGY